MCPQVYGCKNSGRGRLTGYQHCDVFNRQRRFPSLHQEAHDTDGVDFFPSLSLGTLEFISVCVFFFSGSQIVLVIWGFFGLIFFFALLVFSKIAFT